MKLSLFTTKEQKAEYCTRMADAIEQNGLRQAIEAYKRARDEEYGKEAFLKTNNIPADKQEEEWDNHISFLWSQASYLKRKVREYRKEAQA